MLAIVLVRYVLMGEDGRGCQRLGEDGGGRERLGENMVSFLMNG